MQRTYGRRALRRRSGVPLQTSSRDERDDTTLGDPSPPRKRHKVFVEIISPKRKHPRRGTRAEDQAFLCPSPTSGARIPETQLEPVSGIPETPERLSNTSLFTTPFHRMHSDSQPTRGSIVKRMLGRSRTESSLEVTPSTEPTPAPSSAQITRHASSNSLPTTFSERERETTPEVSSSSIPARNIKTYAGSSRSFLVALPVPDANPLSAIEDETEPHESYADLRTRWGIDMSEDDPRPYQDEQTTPTPLKRNPSELSQASLSTGMMNDLKSITELRSKGENRRFLDEVGYLFESLDSSSAIGLRRASAFEIVNKLCDPDFNRRAKTSDFYIRTWIKIEEARGGTSDKIFDITIAFFAALAARDLQTLVDVAHQKEFVPTLVEMLDSFDVRKDVLALVLASCSDDDLKLHGILRTEIPALKSLARLVSKEFISQPSARFLVSHSLATLPPSFLAVQYLPTLLVNLRTELSLLEPRIAAYESGLPLLPLNRRDTPSLFHIEACLRLLDSYLLGHWSTADSCVDRSSIGLSHMDGFTSELLLLCVASSSILEENEREVDLAQKCLCGAMRVLTLLSHDDPWWCEATLEVPHALPFAVMTVMRSQARWSESRNTESRDCSVEIFDLLCLALGLVMNWATLNPEVGVLSRIKSIDPLCDRSRLCIRACRCPSQKSVLECFTTLHVQYSDDHQDDPPECAFLRGYTAILLGLLIKDDTSNQNTVLSMLPGLSPSDKIKSLITHSNSFLDLYSDTVPSPSPDSPRVTLEGDIHVAPDRHQATWDKRGEDIARSVIASLETLCNT